MTLTTERPAGSRADEADLAQRERRQDRLRRPLAAVVVLLLTALLAAAAAASALVNVVAPLALALAAVLAVATWWRPLTGSIVVAVVVPAISGFSRGAGIPGLKISELLLLVCGAALFVRRPARWRAVSASDITLSVVAAAGIALGIYHAIRLDTTVADMVRIGFQPAFLLLAWWTASRGVEEPRDVTLVLRWVLLVSTLPSVIAIAQYVDLPGVRSVLVATVGGGLMPVPGQDAYRVTGPFPIWHSLGGYLMIPTTLAVLLLLRGDFGPLRRPLLLAVVAIDVVGVVLTLTVTILLWLPVAIVVAAVIAKRLTRALAALAALGIAAVLLFPAPLEARLNEQTHQTAATEGGIAPQTLQYRFLIWQRDYVPLLAQAAPLGLGTETPPGVLFDATENQDFTWVLRGGIGLLVTAWTALVAIGFRALRLARRPEHPGRTAAMALFGVVAFLPITTLVWPYVTNAGLPQALMGIGGAALALVPRSGGGTRRPFGPPLVAQPERAQGPRALDPGALSSAGRPAAR